MVARRWIERALSNSIADSPRAWRGDATPDPDSDSHLDSDTDPDSDPDPPP